MAATGVVVTDAVPSALNYVSCTGGTSCSQSGGVVTWNIPSVGAASETVTFTATVKNPVPPGITQIDNFAQVKAANEPEPVDSNIVTNPVAGLGSLILVKTPSPTTYTTVGQVINYSYKLQNVGPVNLTAPYAVTDDKATVTCPQTPTPLTPGAFITCTASYTMTQADLNAGHVTNLATGTAKDSVSPFATVTSNQATATVDAVQTPSLALTKSGLLDTSVVPPSGRANVGDKINYTLTATNSGNVTLTNVSISDPKLGTLSCTPPQPTTLVPNGTLSCTGSYTLTQTDIDAGKVDNTATVNGTDTNNQPVTKTADASVPVPQAPSLDLDKQGTLDKTVVPPADRVDAGDMIHYTLTATNSGNVTLTGVAISDP